MSSTAAKDKKAEQEFNELADHDGQPDDERTLEEMADEEAPIPPLQLAIPGTIESISTSFGGAKPTLSEIRLMGGKLPIAGSFQKGETLDLLVRVRVTGVLGQDTIDEWGATQKTTRRHLAHMIEVKRIDQ